MSTTQPLTQRLSVIPAPRKVRFTGESLRLAGSISLVNVTDASGLKTGIDQLRSALQEVTDKPVMVSTQHKSEHLIIRIKIDMNKVQDAQGYLLDIEPDGIHLTGNDAAGCFYGIQTLTQMIRTQVAEGECELPCVQVKDSPRFVWRGMLVDSARHFQSIAFLKKLIDKLANYKFNIMHWHLVEDQAWRLELRSHPRLVEEASFHSMGDSSRGGFYTQDEIRELVAYADQRFIQIVPEIEMPGHCLSVLTVYPELSCTGKTFTLPERQDIYKDVYCAGNDAVFTFLQEVLDEVMDLFPSPYIHIGGDEVPKKRWEVCPRCQQRMREEGLADENELQSWFITRMHEYLSGFGRRIIGWDELGREGDLPLDVVIQWWRNRQDDAWTWPSQWVARGHQAIFSPTTHCYLDYPLEQISTEKALGLRLKHDPSLITLNQARKHFLGGECLVWTEQITWERFNKMAFPRALAFSEAIWTHEEEPDWPCFKERLAKHM